MSSEELWEKFDDCARRALPKQDIMPPVLTRSAMMLRCALARGRARCRTGKTPRLRVASYEELNAWLLDRCVAYAKAHKHPELADCTIWQAFEGERPQLVQITWPFDGFHATQASVSKTCLVRFDNNKYSVASRAVGRPVEIQAYADRIVIRQDGAIVGEHRRRFGRGETIYDPWHYVPVLARKGRYERRGGKTH
jgi:hypothetical protein